MQISTHVNANANLQKIALAAGLPKPRILCATDLSVRSARAMQRAGLLARQMNAETFFVHAVSDRLAGRVLRMKVNRAYMRLASESESVMKHAPYDATAAVRLGKPLDVLIAAARDYKPDLIVVARPKRRRLDAMLGTTAERIIRGTGCSVLLVGNTAEQAYERVVLATDLSSTSKQVTRTASKMGVLENADAWVVHAFGLPDRDLATIDSFSYAEGVPPQIHWHSTARRDVLHSLRDAGVDLKRVHVSTEQGRPLTAIQRAMHEMQPELLVIGVSRWLALKRILAGSVADQVFRSVTCDVLAISPAAAEQKGLYAT